MWTISEDQLKAIANSMRSKFERRACFAMMKEINNLSEDKIKRIIHSQADKIAGSNIDKEETMMQFIRLSFEYPVLQAETLPENLNKVLSSLDDENTKMENLINLLNTYDYGI